VEDRAVEAARLREHRDGCGAARGVGGDPAAKVNGWRRVRAGGGRAQLDLGDHVEARVQREGRRRRRASRAREDHVVLDPLARARDAQAA
jgi:hypothetical protein